MLTFLSRSIHRLLARRSPSEAALEPDLLAAPASTGLRLLRSAPDTCANRDSAIAVPARPSPFGATPCTPGATAFLAGQGARLYSLEAFRARRRGPAPTPGPTRIGA